MFGQRCFARLDRRLKQVFFARMRVDSIRLFVFMDTVSRHALISLKMANEEDVLLDLSENVIEVKSTPKRKGIKVRTRRWTDEETDIREVAKTCLLYTSPSPRDA